MKVLIPAAAGLVTIVTGLARLWLMNKRNELPWQKEKTR